MSGEITRRELLGKAVRLGLSLTTFSSFVSTLLPIKSLADIIRDSKKEYSEVVVIRSEDIPYYNTALDGFKEAIKSSSLRIAKTYDLKEEQLEELAVEEIINMKPVLVLSIGAPATFLAQKHMKNIPITYTMVLNEKNIDKSRENVKGYCIDIPAAYQLEKIAAILDKDIVKIGIVYDPEQSKPFIEKIKNAIKEKKLKAEINEVGIKSKGDFPGAVWSIVDKIDTYWMAPDSYNINLHATRFLLDFLPKRNIPMIGDSTPFVDIGALMAFYPDPKKIGYKTGELAMKVLNNESVPPISHPSGGDIEIWVNEQVAQKLGIKVPKEWINKCIYPDISGDKRISIYQAP